MTEAEAMQGIAAVAQAHLGHIEPLRAEDPLVEVLRLDSVRMLTLVAELENHFEVILEEGDEVGLVTVGDLVGLLQRRAG